VPDPLAVAHEHVQDRHQLAPRPLAVVVAVIGVVARGEEPQASPAALLGEGADPLGIRFATTARLSRWARCDTAPSNESKIEVQDGHGVSASGSRAVSPPAGPGLMSPDQRGNMKL
jgi:hypothetical protein